MADYPNYSTTPVVQTVTGTGWTIDVTSLALDEDLSVVDFAVYQTFNGDRIPLSSLQKTSSTTITYVGTSMAPDTEIVAMRSTPLSRYQKIRYASEFRSVVYNNEIDNIYTLLAEYTQLSKFLLENFILHPVPFVDELGWLSWDLDGDGEPDAEIPPVNIRGPVGLNPQVNPGYTDVSQLPTADATNVGHGYIINGVLYVSNGTEWVSFGSVAGPSAYDLWLAEGNSGTIQDYLDSLGGQSAYELWLAEGNTGTIQDYLNSLAGKGLQLDGTVGTAGDLPTNPVVPENQIYIVQDTKEFYISNGDGTWTNLGVLYTPIPIWVNETELSWDLTGDGIADTSPVDLKGEGFPTGGTANQIILKASDTDFDVVWATPDSEPTIADLLQRVQMLENRKIVRKQRYFSSNFNGVPDFLTNYIPGSVRLTMRGGGGSGGGGSNSGIANGGGGGGEGELCVYCFTENEISPDDLVEITIGAGGSPAILHVEGLSTGGNGNTGGVTEFWTSINGLNIRANGGFGGYSNYVGGEGGSYGSSTSLGGEIVRTPGQVGGFAALTLNASYEVGGTGGGLGGGSNPFGLPERFVSPTKGGGGCGASVVKSSNQWSGNQAGASGYALLEWLEYAV